MQYRHKVDSYFNRLKEKIEKGKENIIQPNKTDKAK